jgi:hypothetical protein
MQYLVSLILFFLASPFTLLGLGMSLPMQTLECSFSAIHSVKCLLNFCLCGRHVEESKKDWVGCVCMRVCVSGSVFCGIRD